MTNFRLFHGERTNSTSPMILSDPHLGITTPNFWLIAGIQSPSFNVVGLMIPGTPFFALGRNQSGAWGGTNLRAISSHLVRITSEELKKTTSETITIPRRWWFDRTIVKRVSNKGPLISDAPIFPSKPAVALDWLGHRRDGQEFQAFLNLGRTRSWKDFRNNFSGYRVPGLAMLYAGVDGTIGALYAYSQPIRNPGRNVATSPLIYPSQPMTIREQVDLPVIENPADGLIVSCNNNLTHLAEPLSLLPPAPGRYIRLKKLLSEERLTLKRAKEVQRDTLSLSSQEVLPTLVSNITKLPKGSSVVRIFNILKQWDATYESNSLGAITFEHIMYQLFEHYTQEMKLPEWKKMLFKRSGLWKKKAISLLEKSSLSQARLLEYLKDTSDYINEHPTWGSVHTHNIQAPLGNIPFIGRPYRFMSLPAPGTSDTIYKAAGGFQPDEAPVRFGSQARHISDLSDPNENYFILLGGQDGWLPNPNLNDMAKLWEKGKLIKVPLELESFRKLSEHTTVLSAY